MSIKGKTAVVTGSTSGIGHAIALALAKGGANIVVNGLGTEKDNEKAIREVAALGTRVAFDPANMLRHNQIAEMIAKAEKDFGSVDILVNNAGLMLFSNWVDVATQDWNAMIDVNIKGYLNAIAAVLPFMVEQKSGQILNMDSVAGHQVGPAAGVYSATKFFVQAMTESMRKELGVQHGIRVNTVSPGVINTGWADKVTDPEGRKAAKALNEIAIAPEYISRAVIYSLNQPANVTVNDLIISPTRQDW